MDKTRLAALMLACVLTCGVWADEAPVKVTTFRLRDGSKIEAIQYSVMTGNATKAYLITNLEGKKQVVISKDVVSKSEESVPFEKLPEKARQEVLNIRAAALQPEAATGLSVQSEAAVGRRKIAEARTALKKAEEAMLQAQTERAKYEKITKDAPIAIAKADALYDSARAELSGATNAPQLLTPNGVVDHQRADFLRGVMVRAAEDKVRAEQSQREAQDVLARSGERIKQLEENVAIAKKEVENAEAEQRAR